MKKKVLKRILIGIGITAALLLIAAIVLVVVVIATAPKQNASDVEWSFSATISLPADQGSLSDALQEILQEEREEEENFYSELNWYDSLEEAIQDDGMLEYAGYKEHILDSEFLRIETDQGFTIFHFVPDEDKKDQQLMSHIRFARENDKISQPYIWAWEHVKPGWGINDYYFDCDDAVVDYIIFEILVDKVLEERGLQMFFGTWPNKEELESLTIAGLPLKILEEPIEVNEEKYYFWYLTDLSWCDRLSKIPWSSFTYGDVIDILDIEYEPVLTEETE